MKRICLVASVLAATAAPGAPSASSAAKSPTARQQEIARQGAEVMPFDLRRTNHFFDDTPTGGIGTVTVNDPRDRAQIELIRSHLREEAKRFARGDFSDPARIHGKDMPGLLTLGGAARKLKITYKDVPAGGSITFVTRDPQIASAVHEWFKAQRSDHQAHEHMHPN